MRPSIRHIKIDHSVYGAWPLLILFLAIFLVPPGRVPHHHHDHDLHAGDSCARDACHISIYHPGSKEGCDHKTHLTRAADECSVCHINCPRYIKVEVEMLWCAQPESETVFASYRIYDSHSFPAFHADRGPPHFI